MVLSNASLACLLLLRFTRSSANISFNWLWILHARGPSLSSCAFAIAAFSLLFTVDLGILILSSNHCLAIRMQSIKYCKWYNGGDDWARAPFSSSCASGMTASRLRNSSAMVWLISSQPWWRELPLLFVFLHLIDAWSLKRIRLA